MRMIAKTNDIWVEKKADGTTLPFKRYVMATFLNSEGVETVYLHQTGGRSDDFDTLTADRLVERFVLIARDGVEVAR
jgi:hypothetical protein